MKLIKSPRARTLGYGFASALEPTASTMRATTLTPKFKVADDEMDRALSRNWVGGMAV